MSRTEGQLREPVDGQGELFPASQVPRRRSAPPPEVPAQRTRPRSTTTRSSTATPARGRR